MLRGALIVTIALAALAGPAALAPTAASAASTGKKCRFVLTPDPGETGGRADICRTWVKSGKKFKGRVTGEIKDLSSDYHSVILQESRDGKITTKARTPSDNPGNWRKVDYSYSKVSRLYHRVCLVNYGQTKPAVYCSSWW